MSHPNVPPLIEVEQVAPILPARDIAATVQFYTTKLGFFEVYQDADYAIVGRPGWQMHFWRCDEQVVLESSGCYVYVHPIDLLYAQYAAQGVIHPNGALEAKPWGVREFTVLDLNGCILRIGERL